MPRSKKVRPWPSTATWRVCCPAPCAHQAAQQSKCASDADHDRHRLGNRLALRSACRASARRDAVGPLNRSVLIVDSTSARVASREAKAYSGYRDHRCAKVHVVTRKDGQIVDVSQRYPGSGHDKRIWNIEATRLLPMLRGRCWQTRPTLAPPAKGACSTARSSVAKPPGDWIWKAQSCERPRFPR